jgi:PAS domain S-box-containing protein
MRSGRSVIERKETFHGESDQSRRITRKRCAGNDGDGTMRIPGILVVEDEVIVANQIERKLKKIGYTVVGNVRSGQQAIIMAKEHSPDLILMDIKIEGEIDGVETAEMIRSELDIPVIYLTAHADEKTLGRAKHTEPLGYILKPFEEIDLKSTIEISMYKHQIDKRLRESEERYKSLFEGIPIPLFRMDPHGTILTANEALITCLGIPETTDMSTLNLPGMMIDKLDGDRYQRLMERDGHVENFETRIHRHDGSPIWVSINSKLVKDRLGTDVSHEVSMENITIRKKADEELRKKLMNFKMEAGTIYLAQETSPTLSLEAMKDLMDLGYTGTVISRTGERDWDRTFDREFTYRWLAERGGTKTIRPDFGELEMFIETLTQNNVLIMDRFDYLIFKLNFEDALRFIQDLRELAYLKKFIVILSIDPGTVEPRMLRLIEKECHEIESMHKAILSEDLLMVLRFIYRQNTIGIKPSYSSIAKEVRISRPTVRKRLNLLISAGYVLENSRGNSKVMELTERGREIFWK